MAKKTFRIEWDAHEYEHKERSQDWYWAVGIVSAAVAVAAIIFGDIIFGMLVILSAVALSLFINRPPEIIHVTIDERGISRGDVLYPFSTLQSFWVEENHPHPHLLLRSRKVLMPLIVIPIGETDGDTLRDTLITIIPEEPMTLPLVEKILEYLGF